MAQAQPGGCLTKQEEVQPKAERAEPQRQGDSHLQSCHGLSRGPAGQERVFHSQGNHRASRNQGGSEEGTERIAPTGGIRAMLDAIARSCQKNGTDFLMVPPYYTSQTCSLCGEMGRRKKQAFTCTSCGVVLHADFNAARNLRKVGCVTNKRLVTRQPYAATSSTSCLS